jgi:cytochrome P450
MQQIEVIIDERRVNPRPDFISDLANARDAGDKLNDRELFDQIFGICGASTVRRHPRCRRYVAPALHAR